MISHRNFAFRLRTSDQIDVLLTISFHLGKT